jgi:hypothetical protein
MQKYVLVYETNFLRLGLGFSRESVYGNAYVVYGNETHVDCNGDTFAMYIRVRTLLRFLRQKMSVGNELYRNMHNFTEIGFFAIFSINLSYFISFV